jgi:hypothetical protein
MCLFGGSPTGFTGTIASISTTSATGGTLGDNAGGNPTAPAGANTTISIPSYRLSLTAASTTVYLVAFGLFSGGTLSAFGRISGTRVG